MNKYVKGAVLALSLTVGAVGLSACGSSANGQTGGSTTASLQPNQTLGFANGRRLCVKPFSPAPRITKWQSARACRWQP